jgi:hypothetical protein
MKPLLKSVFILCGLGIAAWFAVSSLRNSSRRSDPGTRAWFYDESEKKLSTMPVTTIPPDKGIGGPSGDGEKAVVVTFGKDWHDRGEWRIAYLEKYTAGLKKNLEDLMIACAAHRIFDGSAPLRQSEYFQTNTLVKRQDDHDWYPANSDEGKKIITEWRSWRGPDGSQPVVCPAY